MGALWYDEHLGVRHTGDLRFARLHDLEGNPIEPWEPAGTDLVRPEGE